MSARSLTALALAALGACALLFSAAPALAGTVTNDRPLLFSFDGSGTTLGPFTAPGSLAVDEETGSVYVVNLAGEGKGPGPYDAERVVCKFDAEGNAQSFAALGKSCLDGSETPGGAFGVEGFFGRGSNPDIAVDNSGGAGGPGEGEQGRLYVSEHGGPIHAFDPGGTYLWTLPSSTAGALGIAVDGDGHLWVADIAKEAREFGNSSGSPPSQISSFPLPAPSGIWGQFPAVDQTGNTLYLAQGTFAGGAGGPERWVGGAFDSLLTAISADEITVDQSSPSGHVFTLHREEATGSDIRTVTRFAEFDSSGVQLGSWGDEYLGQSDGAGYGRGIAYNPSLDRVYVSDLLSKTVKIVGDPRSGTVPDVAIEPSTAITRTTATAHGTIDPQSVPNGYRFQWAVGGNEVQHLRVTNAKGGTFTIDTNTCCFGLSEAVPGCCPDITDPLPFNVSPAVLQAALEGLAPIGPGNVSVTGTPSNGAESSAELTPGEYDITFTGALAGLDVNQLRASDVNLEGPPGFPSAQILTTADGPDWGSAQSSPTQSIAPTDSADHPVTFDLTGLTGNTTYSVRLVGTNTDNGLSAYASPPDIFTTLKPPAPTVTIDSIDSITTSSAHVEATIDPQEDTTTWKAQKSTDPSCAGGFVDEPGSTQTISNPGPGPVGVSADLTALLPAQTYCVRITATNSGATGTADKTIQTLAIPPSDARPAFVAPLTDTTARLNARVNPEGEADLEYHFEISEDGAGWSALPDVVSSFDARESIVIAQEVEGLIPDTAYHYRLGALQNSGGPAASLGGARTFTTLTTAEATLPPNAFGEADKRGIELVNSPDKGNQNVFMYLRPLVPYISTDGERARWTVTAGAPGATSGAWAHFLAERTAGGWRSRSLQPPAAEQFGEGAMKYDIAAGPPDLSRFIVDLREQGLASPPEATIARLDTDQHEEVLNTYTWINLGTAPRELGMVDATEDGAHVLTVDTESTRQLEDIGDGTPETVSLMPDGTPSGCGLNTHVLDNPSFVGARHWRPGYHMMATTDASIVYFRARPNGQCVKSPWGLYVRDRKAKKGKGETTLIDLGVPGVTPGTPGVDVEFVRASENGLIAFFTTASKLVPADANAGLDLYRWDHKAKQSTCLSCVVANANLDPAAVMVSDDLSHAYFQSTSQLVDGEGVAGVKNLYVLSEGELRFVAALGGGGEALHPTTAKLSADGNVLLFRSEGLRRLSADSVNGTTQLYRYEDREGSMECLSCAHGALTTHVLGVPGALNNLGDFQLSADGSTAGFVTAQALTPLDVNGDLDVYEWRGGSQRLLTDGLSEAQSGSSASPGVWGIDADGSNILFVVLTPGLTGFERDELANLYVARIGGGFIPPSPPVHCVEDSCQGPLVPPPDLRQPASSVYAGAGNQESGSKPRRPCAKKRGKAKRRCIRRHKRAARRARANREQGRSK